MPILLDNVDFTSPNVSQKLTPQFFSTKLTGNGKTTVGLLHKDLRPTNPQITNNIYAVDSLKNINSKISVTQYGITYTRIPIAPMRQSLFSEQNIFTIPVPQTQNRCSIETNSPEWDISFDMTPQGVEIIENSTKGNRELTVLYRMELFFIKKGSQEPDRTLSISTPNHNQLEDLDSAVFLEWNDSPSDYAGDFIHEALSNLNLLHQNRDELDKWLTNYNVHDRIVDQAEIWNTDKIAHEVNAYIHDLPALPTPLQLNNLALELRYLENYNVSLEAYRLIHQAIETAFEEKDASILSKQNLNLLMSHTLSQLDALKPQLTTPRQPSNTPVLPPQLSKQQRHALTTHDPLVMVQAGAGTGKSTVILERIKYLEQCGIPASNITVLSFTNAAADNITDKNPHVGSMTIARMIHDIYTLNYPDHELSSIDTIINSLEIFYPHDQYAAAFRKHLLDVQKNKTGAFTTLNTFIESHFDETLEMLNTLNQTSLELEIIISYQQIETMKEPAHIQCQYLIIDEVQDNSIFEFIYMLKYVSKHLQSLFIVGDASQTLYEFRSANPRALNTLEGSGVFSTFKLSTNYRSNQEILDFANVVLGDLETNQIAGIQLQANSLVTPTADSFQQKVRLDYRPVSKISDFTSELLAKTIIHKVSQDYIDDCLARGEQVCFLAYSRRDIATIEEALKKKYPHKTIASLVSDKIYSTDIFSKYVKHYWNDVQQVQPSAASFVVAQGIKDNLNNLTRNAGNQKVTTAIISMISKWWVENAPTIQGWEKLCLQGTLNHQEFFDRLRDNILSFEIRHNAVRQSLTNKKNRDRKAQNAESNADLIVSTIHGAKGMEFDNVVILHKESNKMTQASRREYYVAFTRAKKSEYILSYGTLKNPPIESNYEQITNALTKRDARAAALAAGIDPDTIYDPEDKNTNALSPT